MSKSWEVLIAEAIKSVKIDIIKDIYNYLKTLDDNTIDEKEVFFHAKCSSYHISKKNNEYILFRISSWSDENKENLLYVKESTIIRHFKQSTEYDNFKKWMKNKIPTM